MKKRIVSFLSPARLRALCLSLLLAAVALVGSFIMLEYSTFPTSLWDHLAGLEAKVVLLNIGTLGAAFSGLLILTNRVWLASLLTSAVCGTLAVINVYVIKYHGMPLSFLVIKNARTAANILSGYSFSIEPAARNLLLGMAALIALCVLFRRFVRARRPRGLAMWLRNAVLLALSAALLYVGYLATPSIKPLRTIGWIWTNPYNRYGYTACTIETLYHLLRGVSAPDGYQQSEVDAITVERRGMLRPEQTPDIVLILNESFYDVATITDPQTDVSYLPRIEKMDNLLRGYAVVPSEGGGTNNSEYELLTSNSMQLLPGVTPFNFLNLTDANSVVSHLSALGYSTLACHSEPALNYSRSFAYPSLGFETSYFDGDFTGLQGYHFRDYPTDESVYRNALRWYEQMDESRPRFLYVLTVQNHASFDQNPPSADTVHTQRDYGTLTQDMNEFLTSIAMSDAAFGQLTDYFAAVDRPVIVCMVGDHAPYFLSSLETQYDYNEMQLRLRQVPLLVWANFELTPKPLDTMSLNMVVPSLLELAGVRQSPYYDYLLSAREQVPILSAFGRYYAADGTMYHYADDAGGAYEALVDQYFDLEYQNIKTDKNRHLYAPYAN